MSLTKPVLFALGGLVAAWTALGAWVPASHGARVTGDEPQYLMTAISLGGDADLDIADERVEGAWRSFHEAGRPLVQEADLPGDRRVSPHDPLLPALLAGPVRVGGWLGGKLAIATLAGVLASSTAWVAVRRFGVRPGAAVTAAGVFGASAPLAVYGTQVYPELPAALALVLAMGCALAPPSRRAAIGTGAAVVVLPWLSVKYVPVAATLAAVALVRWWRGGRRDLAAGLTVGLVVAGAAYLAAHQAWYGGWTAYAAGDHFSGGELTVVGHTPNYPGRSVRLIGLLTDRHFGLAVWQPAFLLAVPALAAFLRRRPRGWAALVLPLAAGWLTASFVALTMHGWWWPGRQTVVILPALVIATAWWVGQRPRRQLALVGIGVAGIITFGALVAEGLAGRLTLVVDFERTFNPLVTLARAALPDYRHPTFAMWALHAVWLVAAVGLAWHGWRSSPPERASSPSPRPARHPVRVLAPIP
ncbi:MAG: hypothetical protein HYU28_11745 [Actinobacteria bacterium]|nr:hypothetical protein [Actinomycetota bacterium]